jgi:hypothetical protein
LLTVTLINFNSDGELVEDDQPYEVNYVSLFNAGTHGPPALVAPGREQGQNVAPRARPGESVLYINTGSIPAYKIERGED